MRNLKIDLYTDIVCPWCLIGGRRLDNVLARDFPGLAVDIEHHPVLLRPDTPQEGVSIVDLLTERFGRFDREAIWARPEAEARAAGLDLDLGRQAMFYPTLAGHTLIRHARGHGTQHRLSTALASAYFLDARNIADPDVLADIAAEHGFTREEARRLATSPDELDATRRAAEASAARGVRSVPHFVIGGIAVAGARDEARLAAAIRAALPQAQRAAG